MKRSFDGIICFGGEDWWYHNRGHFDMQMMRRFGRRLPVLFINSIGMRVPRPREGRMFLHRMRRKMRSVLRGTCDVEQNFTVLSPPVIPTRTGLALTRRLLLHAVQRATDHRGIRRPLVWVACPTAASFIDALQPAAVVYQRTDRYESFRDVDAQRIRFCDRYLKQRADLTVFCSRHLLEAEHEHCKAAVFIDHGVDLDRFTAADDQPEPAALSRLPRPRVGFVGSIDAHTFDGDLMLEVARRLPEAHFVLVGPCSLQRRWETVPNISMLGQVPLEAVPRYLAACDVLMMPWNRSSWIQSCNPVKLKEYLAAGRPIVSVDFPEARHYDGLVHRVEGAAEFAQAVRTALSEPFDPAARRQHVRDESWESKAQRVLSELAQRRIVIEMPQAAIWPAGATTLAQQAKTSAEAGPQDLHPVDQSQATPAGHCAWVAPSGSPAHARSGASVTACIILSGGLRPSPLVVGSGRCTLDLWLTRDRTVLDCWLDRFDALAAEDGLRPPVRIVHDSMLPPPWIEERLRANVIVEREPRPYRGAAGVLADVTRRYRAEENVLVVEGARYSTVALDEVLERHRVADADVTVAINRDGTPAGIYVVRCGALATVPSAGFLDLKEQWLERATDEGAAVQAVSLDGVGALPLRDRAQFLNAARAAADGNPDGSGTGARASGGGALPEPPSLDGSLRVICRGAVVGPDAVVIDSVIMPGAVIGARAVVARSLICPQSRIQPETDIADAVVNAGRCLSDQRPAYA